MSDKQVAVVTGGAGFIGSHVVDLLLDRGHEVRVIDNLVGGREVNLARLARIDALVAASSRTTEIYATLGVPRARLRTVHLTAGHVAALEPRVIDSPPRPVRFATLAGAASEEKGCLLLLDAARRLEAIAPGAAYTIEVHGLVNERVRDARFFRILNEVPTLLLIIIVIFIVIKPFQ